MKYYETSCNDYIQSSKQFNIHPELSNFTTPGDLSQLGNMIFYGPSGTGKYTQFLRIIEKYSTHKLKTEKISVITEKQTYTYHISDIHYEIDFALLGCESKKIWNECFFQIIDVVSAKKDKTGVILCRNFHAIHSELLDVFYSYIQHCRALSIHITFAILTEHVSFIPNSILQCCKVVSVKRPDQDVYDKLLSKETPAWCYRGMKKRVINDTVGSSTSVRDATFVIPLESLKQNEIEPDAILNLKELRSLSMVSSANEYPKDVFNIICDNIIVEMTKHETIEILNLRDNLYDILLYGLDITECLWYILFHFAETGALSDSRILSEILDKINSFLNFCGNGIISFMCTFPCNMF
jgi:hypothetical protein